jgi:hypothetical protein
MSTPGIPAPLQSPASPQGEARLVLRAKTIATRVTPEELAEVETAAEGAGETVAEWLRELALKALRLWMKQGFGRSRQQEERHGRRTKGPELASALRWRTAKTEGIRFRLNVTLHAPFQFCPNCN